MLTGDIALRVVRMRVISERSIMFLNKSVEAYMVISITTRYDFSRYTVRPSASAWLLPSIANTYSSESDTLSPMRNTANRVVSINV